MLEFSVWKLLADKTSKIFSVLLFRINGFNYLILQKERYLMHTTIKILYTKLRSSKKPHGFFCQEVSSFTSCLCFHDECVIIVCNSEFSLRLSPNLLLNPINSYDVTSTWYAAARETLFQIFSEWCILKTLYCFPNKKTKSTQASGWTHKMMKSGKNKQFHMKTNPPPHCQQCKWTFYFYWSNRQLKIIFSIFI